MTTKYTYFFLLHNNLRNFDYLLKKSVKLCYIQATQYYRTPFILTRFFFFADCMICIRIDLIKVGIGDHT